MLSPDPPATDSGYAWIRLLAAVALTTVGCAGMYISMVAVPEYQTEFSISRGDASLPFTLVMLGFGVGGIVIGRVVDLYGVVRPMAVCVVLVAATFTFAGATSSFPAFAVAHAGLGAFGCAAVFSPLMADVSKWFVRRRGFAIAVCASGNYLAGTVWPPLMQWSIDEFGWRLTYEGFALISLCVMLPLLLIMRRSAPAANAALADGGSSGSPATLGVSAYGLVALLSIAGIGCCVAMAMPQAHAVPLAVDSGLTMTEGARMLSLMFGFGIVSRLVFGWISDRIGGLRTLLTGSTLQCISLVLFAPADTATALYLAAALFGLFQGGIVPCYALIVREYFAESRAGTYTGVVVFATLVGMAFGGWASGAIFDLTYSYTAAFGHGVVWNLVNMAIIGFLVLRLRSARAALSPAG